MFIISEHMKIVNTQQGNPVLAQCVEALKHYLRPDVKVYGQGGQGDKGYDFKLVCDTRPKIELLAELKVQPRLTHEQAQHIIAAAGKTKGHGKFPLLIAPWIGDEVAEYLRLAKVFYIDAV